MDIFVIFDYGRGVVTRPLMGQIVKIAKKQDIKTVVNPKKENFWSYEGIDVIRANKREASHATGVTLINETSIRNMGLKILTSLLCRAALITWIEEGFYLFEQKEKVTFIPPLIDRPVDVTGVGDTITCALALSLAAGATFEEASKVANYAGAIAANQRGLATVSLEELKNAISKGRINGDETDNL
jgi:D-beta-D-heptose 7-phosphate kinase/D-beta-D-heptose 1-phosphate adenosyltransferase